MRILLTHADFMEFEPLEKAVASAEEIAKEKKRIEECLVVFTSVEKGDEGNVESVSAQASDEVAKVAEQVKANRIVVYPFVHLSSYPASPNAALSALKLLEQKLKEKNYDVLRAPFGWYKRFNLQCKGHPLSELSREIKAGEKKAEVSESIAREAQVKKEFFVFTQNNELIPVEKFDYGGSDNLKKFVAYETKKVRAYEKEPPHIKLMKEHGIANYEPGSDIGNFRWLPKGRLIKKLLEKYVSDFCISYGAIEVETPIMYDYAHPALRSYLDRFPARQYVIRGEDRELFLRFSACFGQFLAMHDMVLSHRNLPLKIYELTKYSFRKEQSGELAGLKRVRALTMPDMHTFCRDFEQAKAEFEAQFVACSEVMGAFGIGCEVGLRGERKFFDENRELFLRIARKFGKPVLLELFDERYAYFVAKFEFNFVDAFDKASALSTVQIDVENADVFDIAYTSESGARKRPLILHASLSGSIERVVYALLEKEAMRIAQGKPALLPFWLAPTQLRIIPIADRHVKFAEEVMKGFEFENVRVDVDDRTETLEKKVRDAEMEWIPFIAVVGDREVNEKKVNVRVRESGEKKAVSVEELIVMLRAKGKGLPFEKLSLSPYLSKRPVID